MNKSFPLSTLREGQEATVDTIMSSSTLRRRLQDIGIISGTKIKCLLNSPSGDPVAYLIRGAIIAIRKEDSDQITICPL